MGFGIPLRANKIGLSVRAVLVVLVVALMADIGFGSLYGRFFETSDSDIPKGWYFDPEVGRLHLPNISDRFSWNEDANGWFEFRTNNMGFREDRTTSQAKVTGTRVIVFGDSHTDGVVNNNESFPHVVESILKHGGFDVEVINAGVGCFSLYQEFLLFQRLLPLKPDIAVFTLYTGNNYLEIINHAANGSTLAVNADGSVEKVPPLAPAPRRPQFADYSIIGRVLREIQTQRHRKNSDDFSVRGPAISFGGYWQSFKQADFFNHDAELFRKASYLTVTWFGGSERNARRQVSRQYS